MNIKDILLAPRYGIYRPGTGTLDFELTSYVNGFKLSTSMELTKDQSYKIVKDTLTKYLDQATVYLDEKDLKLVAVLLNATAKGLSYAIDFDDKGITLASLITVDARKIQFIYEKYSSTEYAIQLALTKGSSIKFAWSDSKLEGDFYFNLKRTVEEDITTITGYVDFHLGNDKDKKPVVMSAGVVKRKFIADPNKETDKEDKVDKKAESKVEDHTYVQLRSRSAKGITVKDIISMFIPADQDKESDRIPDALDNVSFYDFAILSRKSSERDKEIHDFAIVIDCDIVISGKKLKTKLTIHTSKEIEQKGGESKSQSFSFSGLVTVDQHQFELKFAKSNTKSSSTDSTGDKSAWSMQASYANSGEVTLDIQRMLKSLFGDGVDVPEMSLKLNKPKVFFIYQSSKEVDKATSKYLFGAGAGIDLKIGELPIAGSVLVKMNALEFKEVLFTYGNNEMTADDLKPLISSKVLPKETKNIRKGLSLTAEIVIDGKSELYTFGGAVTKNAQKDAKDAAENDKVNIIVTDADIKDHDIPRGENEKDKNDTKELPSGATTGANWYIIDKQLGPVNFQRIGFKYHEGRAYVFIDASVKTSALSLSMMGLGVGFTPEWGNLKPSYHLKGLGLSYKTDAVEISGAFLRGEQNGITTYNGAALLKMKSFTISAIGSYAEIKGNTSLFVYGLFQGNIGGPPVFYVTGIAAGFGYNRKINAPEIGDVAKYPLVALAMSGEDTGLDEVLNSLETKMSNDKLPIEISPGNYWLALGVKFTSFKIIESFVLVTVNFGLKTEFNILGLSRMEWPEKALRDKVDIKKPVVYLELAIKVSFGSDSDVIKVDGMITPNSYVISEDCRLFGGFAFYTWISGEHAGDFVLTVGGYHPRFKKPEHYPDVSRVGLMWKMSDTLMLRGELYFALTPSAIMMGGRWDMIFTTDIVKATFSLWIDLYLQWAPFYYELSIGIMIDIEAHIPLKLVTIHLNLHFRAELQIWGPPFAGIAEIDMGIYSFSLRFGDQNKPKIKDLGWDEFATGFLPKPEVEDMPRGSASFDQEEIEEAVIVGDSLDRDVYDNGLKVGGINIVISDGVIQTIEKGKEKIYIANPMQMAISIDSAIPVTKAIINGDEGKQLIEDKKSELGIKPCGFKGIDLDFDMKVMVKKDGQQCNENLSIKKNPKGFPAALWSNSTDKDEKQILSDIMSGVMITTIEPVQYPSDPIGYDFSKLVVYVPKANTDIRIATMGTEKTFLTAKVYSTITDTYEPSTIHRKAVMDDIRSHFEGYLDEDFAAERSCDVIYAEPHMYFRVEPKIASIGAHKHNPTDTKNS